MSKKVYIYTLSEDGSDDVKYVGQTVSPGTRLVGHISHDVLSESNPKRAWIEDVKARSGKIVMSIIDECGLGEAVEREQHWIDHYDTQDGELLNTAKAIRSIASSSMEERGAKPVIGFDGNVSSRDLQREVGRYIDAAVAGRTLTVIRHSRPVAVIISHKMYTRLCERDAELQRIQDTTDDDGGDRAKLGKIYSLILWIAQKFGYSEAHP